MKLSSLIQFAFLALPSVIAKSMYFDIRAQIDIADEVKVMGKHESDEDFVELPRNWRDDDENPGACMTEAGALSWSTSNGACGDKPLYVIVAAFPGIRAGRNSAQIEMPGHTLKVSTHLRATTRSG